MPASWQSGLAVKLQTVPRTRGLFMTQAFPTISHMIDPLNGRMLRVGADHEFAPPLLIRLVVDNKLEELRGALEDDASNIESDHWGYTPLAAAAYVGHVDCLQLLLSKGALPDGPPDHVWGPVALAWPPRGPPEVLEA